MKGKEPTTALSLFLTGKHELDETLWENLDYLSSVVAKYNIGTCADSKDPKDIAAKLN